MLGLDYNNRVAQEMHNIPLSFYHVDSKHPGYHAPSHWHRPCEIIRVISGKLDIFINGTKISASANDIFLINREIIHGFHPRNCVYEIIDFDIDELAVRISICRDSLLSFTNSDISVLVLHPEKDALLHNIANQLFHYASTEAHKNQLLILGTLFELLGALHTSQNYTKSFKNSSNIKLFKPLLEYIENSYGKPITLAKMAQVSGMSTSHFSLLFRDFFRQTPIDYLNSYRVERACLYLINSDLPITEIAYRCGFGDSAYFSKVFKKYKNVTPRNYRGIPTESAEKKDSVQDC